MQRKESVAREVFASHSNIAPATDKKSSGQVIEPRFFRTWTTLGPRGMRRVQPPVHKRGDSIEVNSLPQPVHIA